MRKILYDMQMGLTFDDVLLVPQYSRINSRASIDINPRSRFLKNAETPFISANMDTVTEDRMAGAMYVNGGFAILHRFLSEVKTRIILKELTAAIETTAISIGIRDDEKDRYLVNLAVEFKVPAICIDVAHGDCEGVIQRIKQVKEVIDSAAWTPVIIAGNVATREGARRLFRAGAQIVKVGIGPGCFAAGTRVLMANGTYKNIEQIKTGDFVINKNGQTVKIVGVKFSGFRRVKSYKSSCSWQTSYVTHDHKHYIGDYSSIKDINSVSKTKILDKRLKNGSSKFRWAPTVELDKAFLLMPKHINFEKMQENFTISLRSFSKRKSSYDKMMYENNAIYPSYKLGHIFGAFLGDGHSCISKSKNVGTIGHVKWSFGKTELHIAEKTAKNIKDIFNIDCKINENGNVLEVIAHCKPLAHLFDDFGKKTNKHLPEKYLANNKEYLSGIIDGLIDSDGHIDEERKTLNNTSVFIIELFQICNYILNGYFPSVSQKKISTGNLDYVNIDNFNMSYVAKEHKKPNNFLTDNFQIVSNSKFKVKDTELVLPTYDIEVDCPTHSFIANNVIVHNSHCTTRIVTGHGYPQLNAIEECSLAAHEYGGEIIADGGIRNSGDIAKAIAAGANFVMLGRLLAGCDEAPSEKINIDGRVFKAYRGMASKQAQEDNGLRQKAPEGVASFIPCTGPVERVLRELGEGLQSAMSYSGCDTIATFQAFSEFVRISPAAIVENNPHGVAK